MKAVRMVIGIIVSAIGFLYLLYAYIMIGWGWSDSGGHWSAAQWALTLIPWSVPFLFSLWLVYRCVDSNLKHALAAEVSGLIVLVLFWRAYAFHTRDFPVLVEERPPLVEMRDSGYRPRLPLSSPAVGIEAPDGKFTPMLFLDWPPPGWGFLDLTFDLKVGAPEIKVYRGTNDIAASNHFLGRFQIVGYPKSKPSLDATLLFELSEKKQLFAIARDRNTRTGLKLKPVDTISGQ